jgi:putative ABC transport system permease protein
VRQAIATYGLGGDFGSTWLDRTVERAGMRLLASRHAMVLANTVRRKGRLILTQLVLVTASVMFLMVMSLNSSIAATLDGEFGRRSYDVMLAFENPQRIEMASRLAQSVAGVEKADMWMTVPVAIVHQGRRAEAGAGTDLQGVPVDDPMYAPRIIEGRWLMPGDQGVVVVNRDTAEKEHIRVGDTLTLDLGAWGEHDWQVVGLYQTYAMLGGAFSLDAIYAPRSAVLQVMHRGPRSELLLIRTQRHSAEDTEAVSNQLKDMFRRQNMDVADSITTPAQRRTAQSGFDVVTSMLLVLAVIMAVVGGIGLMGSLSISVVERTKEIGVLRAVGATSRAITEMFMLEGVVQGLLAWLIAVPISLALAPSMAGVLGKTMFNTRMDYQANYQAMLLWLVAILLISALAAVVPARGATRISVRQSLAYE